MRAIEVRGVSKTYKTFKREEGLVSAIKSLFKRNYEYKNALIDANFSVEEGEIIGVVGPNGAGKSTMIKILSGILFPSDGNAEVIGYVPWKERRKYVQHMGVVFGQKEQLWWDLPALDSFHLAKDIYQIPEKEFRQRLDYMLDLLGLKEVAKIPVRDLSLGERMKCKVLMSLLHKPKIVFLDEPSIGLDIIAKDKLRNFILEVNKNEKTTFIITTHDMQDIEKLCKRIIIINHGKIVYDGSLKNIKDKFLKVKRVTVKFTDKIKDFSFHGAKVMRKEDYEIDIELDSNKNSIEKLIDYLITKFDVADINISDPPIEEIIKLIYKK